MRTQTKILLARAFLIITGALLFISISCNAAETTEFEINDFLLGIAGAGFVAMVVVSCIIFLNWLSETLVKNGFIRQFTQEQIDQWVDMINYANYQNYFALVSAYLKPLDHDEPLTKFYHCSKAVQFKDGRHIELVLSLHNGEKRSFLFPIARIPDECWKDGFSLVAMVIRSGFNNTQHIQRLRNSGNTP